MPCLAFHTLFEEMRLIAVTVVSAIALGLVACREPADVPIESGHFCYVESVVDADTIHADCFEESVRLLLVDAPEIARDGQPGECFGAEAAGYLRTRLPEGTRVRFEAGILDTDRFGRHLRYIWLGHELLNDTLVREGWATRYRAAEDTTHQARIIEAENEARVNARGLWSAC
jgi:micrococcal nuclease